RSRATGSPRTPPRPRALDGQGRRGLAFPSHIAGGSGRRHKERFMGKIVFAGAMSHVLDPEYYDQACGAIGRKTVNEVMAEIAKMGERFSATKPDALIVVADDHLNAFSFNCVPAFCVRIGKQVQRMTQDHAEAFDKVLDDMPV